MMIIRQLITRKSRCFSRTITRPWPKSYTTTTDDLHAEISDIEASASNSLQETHSIESLLQSQSSEQVPRIDDESYATTDLATLDVVRKHQALKRQQSTTGRLGTDIAPHYQPHQQLTQPLPPSSITLEVLLASQSHLGHSTSLWNPMNSRYIFGIRQGIHIISLDVTASHLRRACRVVSGVAERGGLILFVGTRAGQDRCVVNAATLSGGCHLFQRWIPGSITNGDQILGRCKLKIVDEFDREITDEEARQGLREHQALKPDLVVCMNPLENWVLLHECGMNNIPTIGIIDTDADPTWVTYPIPANDDSLRCVQLIAGALGKAGQEGHHRRLERAKEGDISYEPSRFLTDTTRDARAGGRSTDVRN